MSSTIEHRGCTSKHAYPTRRKAWEKCNKVMKEEGLKEKGEKLNVYKCYGEHKDLPPGTKEHWHFGHRSRRRSPRHYLVLMRRRDTYKRSRIVRQFRREHRQYAA